MHKIRKFRLYHKYNVDLWGWLMYQRTNRLFKVLAKILYRTHMIKGPRRWKLNEKYQLWKSYRLRKGFGRHRSVFKKRMQEKQKTQFFYGFAREKQLKRIYEKARLEKGLLADNFAGLLESRLLSIAYRLGYFDSMRIGVQYIVHHGLTVDGRKIKSYNYVLLPGQVLDLVKGDLHGIAHLRKVTVGSPNGERKFFFPFWFKNLKEFRVLKFWKKKRSFRKKIGKSTRELPEKALVDQLNRWLHLRYPPGYLEVNFPLRKVMLVYRPRCKEIFYPYPLDLNEVVTYFKYH